MTFWKFIWRSISYYRKQHLALFLGIILTAAVLTGALIVGDSIRYSLNRLVEVRLGNTRLAMIGGSRFVEAELAQKLDSALKVPVTPVLLLKGMVLFPDSGIRIQNAQVIGVDSTFNYLSAASFPIPAGDEVVVGKSLAERIGVSIGDELVIRVESASLVPVNAPFAQEPPASTAFRAKITAIAGDDMMGRFSLGNAQSVVYNVFVSGTWLAQRMDLEGLANTLLTADEIMSPGDLVDAVQKNWTLKDLGLALKDLPGTGYFDLVSNRVFMDTVVEKVLQRADLSRQEVISYMINDISLNGRHTPYSFASAVSSEISGIQLGSDEVVINRWTADDLDATVGDSITLTYFEIGPLRNLQETSHRFAVKSIMPTTTETVNNSLMPDFQGMSEAGSCSEWDAGVPVDLERIRDKDEDYWDDYRGTPKVLLSLETGRKLWKNPFGTLTLVRFHEDSIARTDLANLLTGMVRPSDIGLQVADVRSEGSQAVDHAVNFTELFLGMSFFVILTGILLTVLIYTLHMSRRSVETSLLTGMGFTMPQLLRLRLLETSLVILTGSIAGALLGVLYNKGLLAALNTVWNDIVRMDMLVLHVKTGSLVAGVILSMLIALLPLYFITVKHFKDTVASRVKGATVLQPVSAAKRKRVFMLGALCAGFSLLLVMVSLALQAVNHAILYLSAATMVLSSGILFVYGFLKPVSGRDGRTIPSLMGLAWTNLQRNTSRSLSVIALLALGTFTVVLTGSYRKTFFGTEMNRNSGTGGYLLWTEFTSPVPFDLNSTTGRERLLLRDTDDLSDVRFLQFDALNGDDASCLNLNQVNQPRLLAVHADSFDSAGAFTFIKMLDSVDAVHPWLSLNKALNDSTFPAYVDQTVLQYSLQRKLGDTLIYKGESGKTIRLVLAGTLNNTIFQGNVLVAEPFFRTFFPSAGGTRVMLTDAPPERQEAVMEMISNSLTDYGPDITPTSQRLANFNSVTNTYLTVFMALSGLGFIIGTIGLGIVLLRNVHERRRELALLLSLGYARRQVFKLVLLENFFLLAGGWGIGMLSAFIGVLPSLLSPSFDLQGGYILLLTLGILVNGLLWIYLPLRSALRSSLIPALRND